VKVNSPVTIEVTSDTADEVHLHGYDIEKELVPGKVTTLSFVADQTGIFEVELHKANVVILHLQVQ
jgi:heme/copper-type cytochrome/quinol oxidase subunit 2